MCTGVVKVLFFIIKAVASLKGTTSVITKL